MGLIEYIMMHWLNKLFTYYRNLCNCEKDEGYLYAVEQSPWYIVTLKRKGEEKYRVCHYLSKKGYMTECMYLLIIFLKNGGQTINQVFEVTAG